MIEYKCEWDAELDRRKRLNLEGPEPIPHPDHIIIDPNNGDVRVTGPMTKEAKVKWDRLRARKTEYGKSIQQLQADLQSEPDEGARAIIKNEIEHEENIYAVISRVIVD